MNLEDFQAQFEYIVENARQTVGGDTTIDLYNNLDEYDRNMEELYNLCLRALGEL